LEIVAGVDGSNFGVIAGSYSKMNKKKKGILRF